MKRGDRDTYRFPSLSLPPLFAWNSRGALKKDRLTFKKKTVLKVLISHTTYE